MFFLYLWCNQNCILTFFRVYAERKQGISEDFAELTDGVKIERSVSTEEDVVDAVVEEKVLSRPWFLF